MNMQQLGAVILLIGVAFWLLLTLLMIATRSWWAYPEAEVWGKFIRHSKIWLVLCVLASLTPLIYEKLQ